MSKKEREGNTKQTKESTRNEISHDVAELVRTTTKSEVLRSGLLAHVDLRLPNVAIHVGKEALGARLCGSNLCGIHTEVPHERRD